MMMTLSLSIFLQTVLCFISVTIATDEGTTTYFLYRDPSYSVQMHFKPEELEPAARCLDHCVIKGANLIENAMANFCQVRQANCTSHNYFGRWGPEKNFELFLECFIACTFINKVEQTPATKLRICDAEKQKCTQYYKVYGNFNYIKYDLDKCNGWRTGDYTTQQNAFVCDENKLQCRPLTYFLAQGVTNGFNMLAHCFKYHYLTTYYRTIDFLIHGEFRAVGRIIMMHEDLNDAAKCCEHCVTKDEILNKEATASFCLARPGNCILFKYYGKWTPKKNFDLHVQCFRACNFVNKVEQTGSTILKICDADKQNCTHHYKEGGTFENFKSLLNKCNGWRTGDYTTERKAFVCDEEQLECWPLSFFHSPSSSNGFAEMSNCFKNIRLV